MKNNDITLQIAPKVCPCRTNPESSANGEADTALNLRECEQGLVVTGQPRRIAQLADGETLLLVDDGHLITAAGGNLLFDGTAVCSLNGATPHSACASGQFITVLTSAGMLHFSRKPGGITLLDTYAALPLINLCETEAASISCPLPSYTFSRPLTVWQSPLPSEDAANLAKRESQVRTTLARSADAQGRHTGLMLVRYGVRMWDDSYLWMSAPVLLGGDYASGNYRHTATATTSGSSFTGIKDSSVAVSAYRIGLTVLKGIDSSWHGIVKAIDLLATKEIAPYDTSMLDYRFSRPDTLDFGPAPISKSAVVAQLLRSDWHVVATTNRFSALSNHGFSALNVAQSTQTHFPGLHSLAVGAHDYRSPAITPATCAAAVETVARRHIPVSVTKASGRLVAAGGAVRNAIPWSAASLVAGSSTSGTSTLTTIVKIATPQGFADMACTDSLPFVPSALGQLLTYPDSRAVSATFTLRLADGTVRSCTAEFSPTASHGMAVCINSGNLAFSASAADDGTTASHFDEDADGLISAYLPGNPFVQAFKRVDTGLHISSVCAARRPLQSGSLSRHPLYVFASQGIFAMPYASTSNGFGEPRPIAGNVAAQGMTPCCADSSVWFIDCHNRLCRLTGTSTEVVTGGIAASAMAWDGKHSELHLASASTGMMTAVQPSGRTSSRSTTATALLNCGSRAYAVTPDGSVCDLTDETADAVSVSYKSQPVVVSHSPLGARLAQVVWNVCGTLSSAKLTVCGERGLSCHGFPVSTVTANGTLGAPLPVKLISPPLRTFRLTISGTLTPGTLILPLTVKAFLTRTRH